jgi:hypothetical protein
MSEEPLSSTPDDEIDDEMPVEVHPCGDIFDARDSVVVTDADAQGD